MNSVTTSLPIVISCSICPGYRAVVGWFPDGLSRALPVATPIGRLALFTNGSRWNRHRP
jgi:hypothetical protein